jgi:hypothetical protein
MAALGAAHPCVPSWHTVITIPPVADEFYIPIDLLNGMFIILGKITGDAEQSRV